MIRKHPDAVAIGAILLLLPFSWWLGSMRHPAPIDRQFIQDMRIQRDQLRRNMLEQSETLRQERERMRHCLLYTSRCV